MRRILRVRVLLIVVSILGLAAGLTVWVKTRPADPSYESTFVEFIWLAYPTGGSLTAFREKGEQMDSILRERKAGYLAGFTSRGDPPEIVEVELAVDLDLEAGKKLIEEFTALGIVPEDLEVSAGTYPREDLLEARDAGW
tara:strand:- start:865 stop:1284 length:420 start_codon:yes stop_codon:yes gene_type:complete